MTQRPFRFGVINEAMHRREQWLDHARCVEQLGYDTFLLRDHFISDFFGEQYAPLVALTAAALSTRTLRVGTLVIDNDYRHPVMLAKEAATLDVMSGGRLELGIGAGWQREEYEANGIAYDGRGKLLDETLEVCQTLWRDESARHSGTHYRFEKIHLNPKPLHPCGVPFWVSGTLNPNVLQRIVKYGSGWIPWGDDGMNPIEGLKKIKDALVKAGRSPEGFEATSYLQVAYGLDKKIDVEKTMALAPTMVAGGLTDLRITLELPKSAAAVEDLLTPLVQAFRRNVGRR